MTTQITLVGNLTADPELRFTPAGNPVANFTVAVNESRKNPDGTFTDLPATYFRCAAWQGTAEHIAASLRKGQRVLVQGSFRARPYERPDGSKALSLDVTVSEVGPALRWATASVERAARPDAA